MKSKLLASRDKAYELPLSVLLNDARSEEKRARAEVMSSRLCVVAWKIERDELNRVEIIELLRQEAENWRNEAGVL